MIVASSGRHPAGTGHDHVTSAPRASAPRPRPPRQRHECHIHVV